MKRTILAVLIMASTSAFAHTSDFVGSGDYNYDKGQQKMLDQKQSADILTNSNSITRQARINMEQDGMLDNHEGRITYLEQHKPLDGKDGKDGAQGIQGVKGNDGKDGKDGINGTNGADGATGAAGHDGIDGNAGKDGRDGADGLDGAAGKDGSKGDKGDTGALGASGNNGADGKAGANGKDADMSIVHANAERANKQFASLRDQVNDNEKKANAGSSSALAAAAIPQVTDHQQFTLGAGIGVYEGEQAVAVGFSARASESVTIKAAVTTDTQQGVGYNAGVAIGW